MSKVTSLGNIHKQSPTEEYLNIREQAFINEYLINGGNGTSAVLKAGYKSKELLK